MTLKRIFQLLFFILLVNITLTAQLKPAGVGAALGIGEIKGNSPSVTSFGSTIFFDFLPWFSNDVTIRTGFTYARKIEYFLPENRQSRYYPSIRTFSLRGVLNFEFSSLLFVETSSGLMVINDRTFGDVNEWEPGVSFSVMGGLDFSNQNSEGFRISLGMDSGIAFTKTSASYYLINFQVQYLF